MISLRGPREVILCPGTYLKEGPVADQQQQHPLHGRDRPVVDRLLQVESPRDQDLVDGARLLQRYRNFPGAEDIRNDLKTTLKTWGLSQSSLYHRSRAIWASGFQPNLLAADDGLVGSGFDSTSEAPTPP